MVVFRFSASVGSRLFLFGGSEKEEELSGSAKPLLNDTARHSLGKIEATDVKELKRCSETVRKDWSTIVV